MEIKSFSNEGVNDHKQNEEKKSTLRCASLRGVEFFPHGKRGEREGAAQGGFLLFILFKMKDEKVPLTIVLMDK